ncbi:MAG: hypothetical protein K2X28_06835 [Alphaproteobacteria bacterium]|nr:hypothetical protein [Alphaproteobacteria bacterium]
MIKKYVLFLAIAITFSGNVNAIPPEEFERFLDRAQTHYPVLKDLRIEQNFKKSVTKFLEESPEKKAEEILNICIKENIRTYINLMGRMFYFELVEDLDPVYRDLNPDCGTSGNGRTVKGIFSHN